MRRCERRRNVDARHCGDCPWSGGGQLRRRGHDRAGARALARTTGLTGAASSARSSSSAVSSSAEWVRQRAQRPRCASRKRSSIDDTTPSSRSDSARSARSQRPADGSSARVRRSDLRALASTSESSAPASPSSLATPARGTPASVSARPRRGTASRSGSVAKTRRSARSLRPGPWPSILAASVQGHGPRARHRHRRSRTLRVRVVQRLDLERSRGVQHARGAGHHVQRRSGDRRHQLPARAPREPLPRASHAPAQRPAGQGPGVHRHRLQAPVPLLAAHP